MFYSILEVDNSLDYDIEYIKTSYMNIDILLKVVNDTYFIERIYSSNPKDYLNPDMQPGIILENTLINRGKKCYNEY